MSCCVTPARTPSPSRPQSTNSGITALLHHPRYYFDDGAVFLVQETLFKVPRYMLVNESPVFEGTFQLPKCAQPEGSVDTAPIRLGQVQSLDFERLLELLYPTSYANFATGTKNWGEPEWTSILHLASLWMMGDIRSQALAQLSSCAGPISKISLGRKYDHLPWIRDGFLQLCLRDEPLTMKEAEELGLKEAIGVAQARERMRSEVIPSSCEETPWGSGAHKTRHCTVDYYESPHVHHILDETFDLQEPFRASQLVTPRSLHSPSPVPISLY